MMSETNLEKIIADRGIKKIWLAGKVGIAPGTLSNILKGSIPTLPVALKIAYILDITVEQLWGDLIEEWKEEREKE